MASVHADQVFLCFEPSDHPQELDLKRLCYSHIQFLLIV
jgi:hypothetical protein